MGKLDKKDEALWLFSMKLTRELVRKINLGWCNEEEERTKIVASMLDCLISVGYINGKLALMALCQAKVKTFVWVAGRMLKEYWSKLLDAIIKESGIGTMRTISADTPSAEIKKVMKELEWKIEEVKDDE